MLLQARLQQQQAGLRQLERGEGVGGGGKACIRNVCEGQMGGGQMGPIMGGGQEDSSHPDSASACP